MEDRVLVKNSADPEQVRKADEKVKNKRLAEIDDLKIILGTLQGRRVFWKYLGLCGLFTISYTGDPNDTIFREGARNIGLRITSDIMEADADAYLKMMQENREKH